jgi:hypothetical protein
MCQSDNIHALTHTPLWIHAHLPISHLSTNLYRNPRIRCYERHTHTQSKLWHNHAYLVTVETCVWLNHSFMHCGSFASNSDCDISAALCWCFLNPDFCVVATDTRAPWPLGCDSIARSNRHTSTHTADCRRCQFSSSYFDCVSGSDDIHYFYQLALISRFVFTVVTSLAPGIVLTFHTSSFCSSFFITQVSFP